MTMMIGGVKNLDENTCLHYLSRKKLSKDIIQLLITVSPIPIPIAIPISPPFISSLFHSKALSHNTLLSSVLITSPITSHRKEQISTLRIRMASLHYITVVGGTRRMPMY